MLQTVEVETMDILTLSCMSGSSEKRLFEAKGSRKTYQRPSKFTPPRDERPLEVAGHEDLPEVQAEECEDQLVEDIWAFELAPVGGVRIATHRCRGRSLLGPTS